MVTAPAALALLAKLDAHGWTAALTEGEGIVEVTGLGDERGDGTRPRITVAVPCKSVGVSATHPDGRALVVAWETHTTTSKGAPSWSRVMAWRRRRGDEGAPVQLKAADLDAYVAAPDRRGEAA